MIKHTTRFLSFWARVDKNGPNGCWVWTGNRDAKGYGRWRRQGYAHAHRYSYFMSVGEIPAGMCVCHHCDNPPCVNPSHLFVGTHRDNMLDRDRKGRNRPPMGERHPQAKLTWAKVRDLRARYSGQRGFFRRNAKAYGVSQVALRLAVLGISWKRDDCANPSFSYKRGEEPQEDLE